MAYEMMICLMLPLKIKELGLIFFFKSEITVLLCAYNSSSCIKYHKPNDRDINILSDSFFLIWGFRPFEYLISLSAAKHLFRSIILLMLIENVLEPARFLYKYSIKFVLNTVVALIKLSWQKRVSSNQEKGLNSILLFIKKERLKSMSQTKHS